MARSNGSLGKRGGRPGPAGVGAPGAPTAYSAASLMSAIGALAAIRGAGLEVPGQVSLIAFNDHPFAQHTAPPLTTVRMPNFRMGQEAVRMLLGALAGVRSATLSSTTHPSWSSAPRPARRLLSRPVAPARTRRVDGRRRRDDGSATNSPLRSVRPVLPFDAHAITEGEGLTRSLSGRVAIVTGAGQGMGRAFAQVLAGAGATVAVAELDPTTGPAAAAESSPVGVGPLLHRGRA